MQPPTPAFFNPRHEIQQWAHYLPHWQQGAVFYFVTWRLADALPQVLLSEWRSEREHWYSLHPEPWDERTQVEYHRRFNTRIEHWLDQGSGSSLLKHPFNAECLAEVLLHEDKQAYHHSAFVIMPNHVHVLFRLLDGGDLGNCVRTWKSCSAHAINRRLKRKGSLWQEDYWDRMVRNEKHWRACLDYIRRNPTKAGLNEGEYFLYDAAGTVLE